MKQEEVIQSFIKQSVKIARIVLEDIDTKEIDIKVPEYEVVEMGKPVELIRKHLSTFTRENVELRKEVEHAIAYVPKDELNKLFHIASVMGIPKNLTLTVLASDVLNDFLQREIYGAIDYELLHNYAYGIAMEEE